MEKNIARTTVTTVTVPAPGFDKITSFLSSDAPARIGEIIGYTFRNPHLLAQAFCHRSYTAGTGGKFDDNEVLEFIGDKVLDVVVLKTLVMRYGQTRSGELPPELTLDRLNKLLEEKGEGPMYDTFRSDKSEGDMTDLKIALVRGETLADEIDRMGLAGCLITGAQEGADDVSAQKSVRENLFEALLGAVALDCGWDFAVLTTVVERMLRLTEKLDNGFNRENYVGKLQEMVQALAVTVEPEYDYLQKNEQYVCTLTLKGMALFSQMRDSAEFIGVGHTKKEAASNAAEQACALLDNIISWSGRMGDVVGAPDPERAVNQLQELWQKGIIGQPVYNIEKDEINEQTGNAKWRCTCRITDPDITEIITADTKMTAKRYAALSVLFRIVEQPIENHE